MNTDFDRKWLTETSMVSIEVRREIKQQKWFKLDKERIFSWKIRKKPAAKEILSSNGEKEQERFLKFRSFSVFVCGWMDGLDREKTDKELEGQKTGGKTTENRTRQAKTEWERDAAQTSVWNVWQCKCSSSEFLYFWSCTKKKFGVESKNKNVAMHWLIWW